MNVVLNTWSRSYFDEPVVATANNQESLRLFDPRYQMSFHAEEVDAQTSE